MGPCNSGGITRLTQHTLKEFCFTMMRGVKRQVFLLPDRAANISQGKNLLCFPEFVCRDWCSRLVLLRKVIDASGIYLYRNSEETHEERLM